MNIAANETTSHVTEAEVLGFTVNTILLTIHGLQGCVAIIANLITIIAVCKFHFLKEDPACRLVASLACADLVAGFATFLDITLGSNITVVATVWIILCKTKVGLDIFSIFGNLYSLLFVTVDRFLYIVKPLRYVSIVTIFRTNVCLLFLWPAIIVHVLMLLIFDYDNLDKKRCSTPDDMSQTGISILSIEFLLITFGIILPCYSKIILTVRHLKRTEPHLSHFAPELRAKQTEKLRQRKMTITMALVLATFFICYFTPFFVSFVVGKLFSIHIFSFRAILSKRIGKLILWNQTMINTFIYGWRNQSFRKAYKKLFHIPQSNSNVNLPY